MIQELAYSFHLGRDKNRSISSQEKAKTNTSGGTSYANNAIKNLKDLSDSNKHNLRAYDNKVDDIEIIYGTNNVIEDVKKLYLNEFEESQKEYNKKQKRDDRKIDNYFDYVSNDEKKDLACEIIIELGDMDFWNNKDMQYKKQMTPIFVGQVDKLMELIPSFKVANAVIHYDETSPHLHILGVPIVDGYKTGMKKQVCKSKVFTKESLTKLQDDMRKDCIERFNNVYEQKAELKQKHKGRNKDFNVKDMGDYKAFKKNQDKNNKRIDSANKKCDELDIKKQEVDEILSNLKAVAFNKNIKQISNDDIDKIKELTTEVGKTTKEVKKINHLKVAMEDFENTYTELKQENNNLEYENGTLKIENERLKNEISLKDKIIVDLKEKLAKVKSELNYFIEFWKKILTRFQQKIFDEKLNNVETDKRYYTIVEEDLEKCGIFNSDESGKIKDISHKIKYNANEVNNRDKSRKNNLN